MKKEKNDLLPNCFQYSESERKGGNKGEEGGAGENCNLRRKLHVVRDMDRGGEVRNNFIQSCF